MKELFAKMFNVIAFVLIFVFYITYSSFARLILEKLNIDIDKISIVPKTIILVLIELVLVLILCFIYRKDLKKEFRIYKNNFGKNFFFSIKWWLLGLIFMGISNLVLHFVFHSTPNNENEVQKLLGTMPVYIAIASCVFAPIMEELVFRKSLNKCFSNNYLFILTSGLIFGLLHVISSQNVTDFLYIIPYGAFGCIFAYIFVKTKTIFSTITIHMIHNTILVMASLTSLGVF